MCTQCPGCFAPVRESPCEGPVSPAPSLPPPSAQPNALLHDSERAAGQVEVALQRLAFDRARLRARSARRGVAVGARRERILGVWLEARRMVEVAGAKRASRKSSSSGLRTRRTSRDQEEQDVSCALDRAVVGWEDKSGCEKRLSTACRGRGGVRILSVAVPRDDNVLVAGLAFRARLFDGPHEVQKIEDGGWEESERREASAGGGMGS